MKKSTASLSEVSTDSGLPLRLDFSRAQSNLYGRDKEIETIRQVFENKAQDHRCQSQVVLIHGYAGAGKTTLVRQTLQKIAPIYAEGSYQQFSGTRKPFSALMQAYQALKQHPRVQQLHREHDLLATNPGSLQRRTSINFDQMEDQMSSVGDSHSIASSSIFYDGISVHSAETDALSVSNESLALGSNSGHGEDSHGRKGYSFERLKSKFRNFLRSICSPSNPVVIVQDNLQYADTASLEVWKHLIMDRQCRGLIMVGIYRDNEITSVLKATIVSLVKNCGRRNRLTRIPLGDLNLGAINELVADVTLHPHNPDKTIELSQVVLRKTSGNVYFVIQFLRVLQDEELLFMNFGTYKWDWKIDDIITKTSLSDNVVDLVANKVQKLPPYTRHALKMAACLGIKFDIDTLAWVSQWQDMATLGGCLQQATDLMLLESCVVENNTSGYRFGHERIQQVAYNLIESESERNQLHLTIGRRLRYLIKSGLAQSRQQQEQQQQQKQQQQYSSRNLLGSMQEQFPQHQYQGMNAQPQGQTTQQVPPPLPLQQHQPPPAWLILTAADQLNAVHPGVMNDPRELLDLIGLNVAAADRVMQRSAFFPARNYLLKAQALLPSSPHLRWKQHYNMCLNVWSKLAGIECSLGRFSECQQLAHELLGNARSPREKLAVQLSQVEAYSSQGRLQIAIDICGHILSQWGEGLLIKNSNGSNRKFTRAMVSTEHSKTNTVLKGMKNSDIMMLPKMTSEKISVLLKLYCKLSHLSWWADQRELCAIVCLRAMRLTVEHGMNEVSSHAISLYAQVLSTMGYHEKAIRFGQLALEVMDTRPETRQYAARTLIPVHTFVNHIDRPLHESLDSMLYAYKMGMETGDCPFGFLAATTYASIYFVCGLPLEALQDDLKSFSDQMATYNQSLSGNVLNIYWQTVLNFMGKCQNVYVLNGDAMEQTTMMSALEDTNQTATLRALYYCRMVLAFHFGHYDLAANMADMLWTSIESDATLCTAYSRNAYMALSFIVGGAPDRRKTRNKKLGMNRAKKCCKIMESRKVNCQHLLLLVQAERFAAKDRAPVEQARSLFKDAITSASRRGTLHEAALANERLAIFMFANAEKEWGEHYVRMSHRLYDEWGASAKVLQMERKYEFLSDRNHLMTKRPSSRNSIKGRQRFSFKIAKRHMTLDTDPADSEGSGSFSLRDRSGNSGHSRTNTPDINFGDASSIGNSRHSAHSRAATPTGISRASATDIDFGSPQLRTEQNERWSRRSITPDDTNVNIRPSGFRRSTSVYAMQKY